MRLIDQDNLEVQNIQFLGRQTKSSEFKRIIKQIIQNDKITLVKEAKVSSATKISTLAHYLVKNQMALDM